MPRSLPNLPESNQKIMLTIQELTGYNTIDASPEHPPLPAEGRKPSLKTPVLHGGAGVSLARSARFN